MNIENMHIDDWISLLPNETVNPLFFGIPLKITAINPPFILCESYVPGYFKKKMVLYHYNQCTKLSQEYVDAFLKEEDIIKGACSDIPVGIPVTSNMAGGYFGTVS